MYKIIDDVVNWGIFLCVFPTTAISVGVSNSFRKKQKFNKVLPFFSEK